jgi:hypothetical protein
MSKIDRRQPPATAGDGQAVEQLRDVVATARRLHRVSEEVIERAVVRARVCGASWSEVGRALGVTRQGAQQRYGHVRWQVAIERTSTGTAFGVCIDGQVVEDVTALVLEREGGRALACDILKQLAA